jgi:DNA/RNA endonuclease YhcR with UshA esterase domain
MRNVAPTIIVSFFLFLFLYLGVAAQERISAVDATKYVGKKAIVCGQVASSNYASGSRGRPTFLNLDRPYPNHIFTALIWGEDRIKFSAPPESAHGGKKICVTGTISSYEGRAQIVVRNPSQITSE